MNNIFESAKFEPKPTVENTIDDIKADHFKIITSIDMNVSAITLNKASSSSEHMISDLIPWILLKSPEKSPQFTNHLSLMYPNGNTQLKFENGGYLLDQHYFFSLFSQNFVNTSQ